jgi:hypothetical protein
MKPRSKGVGLLPYRHYFFLVSQVFAHLLATLKSAISVCVTSDTRRDDMQLMSWDNKQLHVENVLLRRLHIYRGAQRPYVIYPSSLDLADGFEGFSASPR